MTTSLKKSALENSIPKDHSLEDHCPENLTLWGQLGTEDGENLENLRILAQEDDTLKEPYTYGHSPKDNSSRDISSEDQRSQHHTHKVLIHKEQYPKKISLSTTVLTLTALKNIVLMTTVLKSQL